MVADWQPSASIEILKLRARLLQKLRAFFSARDIWEVETPSVSQAATTDPNIESFTVAGSSGMSGYLHTSPEFPMKRLLAAGSGSIFQVCKVFRQGERGRRHNPEFSLVEWYHLGFEHHQLMAEVEMLVRELLDDYLPLAATQKYSYREAFRRFVGIDPFSSSCAELAQCASSHGITDIDLADDRDAWLDLLASHVLENRLPANCPVFIYDYPGSQASLAQICAQQEHPVAERFELYINGMELANGFHELKDSREQQGRFERDLNQRQKRGQALLPMDRRLLAALEAGLPDCAGVALGFDRLLMLAAGKASIAEVISFEYGRA